MDRLEITFTLHGLDEYNQDVDGEVFAKKFSAFVRGLGKADKAANGVRRHRFLLTDLKKNTATASLREQQTVKGPYPDSSIEYYGAGLEAIYSNSPRARALPAALVRDIAALNTGVGHTFAFGEVKTNRNLVIRIDDYLAKRARGVLAEIGAGERQPTALFSGIAFGSYDGVLKAVDLRGDVQKAALVLTAGGREIECIVNTVAVARLGEALDRRVVVSGRAHYDGVSQLPVRLDIQDLKLVKARREADLARWRGSFDMTEASQDDGWN